MTASPSTLSSAAATQAARRLRNEGVSDPVAGIPSNAVAAAPDYYLTLEGDLYWANWNRVVTKLDVAGVTSIQAVHNGWEAEVKYAIVMAAGCAPTVAVDGYAVINGACALLGTLGPGFAITAGASANPAGTQIVVESTSALTVNAISLSGQGLADIVVLGGNRLGVTLTSPIPVGGQMNLRWLLSITVLTTTTATLTLPSGYTPSTGTKPQGGLQQTLVLCNPS